MSALRVDMQGLVCKNIYHNRKVIVKTFQQVQSVYYYFRLAMFLLSGYSMEMDYCQVSFNELFR